ncbi:ECF subfamily RNA polymerase sigma-70 factor [Sphingomonas sp. LH128]|nr:ECF subfamily RNA polymerase sigma-70 factor [Sphingomonas sp. LH128]
MNLHIDERRKASSRGTACYLELDDLLVDPTPLQDETLDARRQWEAVQNLIERLPERTREVLFMRRVDGMRYKDIARELDISESAVEKHIAKAATLLLRASKNR